MAELYHLTDAIGWKPTAPLFEARKAGLSEVLAVRFQRMAKDVSIGMIDRLSSQEIEQLIQSGEGAPLAGPD